MTAKQWMFDFRAEERFRLERNRIILIRAAFKAMAKCRGESPGRGHPSTERLEKRGLQSGQWEPRTGRLGGGGCGELPEGGAAGKHAGRTRGVRRVLATQSLQQGFRPFHKSSVDSAHNSPSKCVLPLPHSRPLWAHLSLPSVRRVPVPPLAPWAPS